MFILKRLKSSSDDIIAHSENVKGANLIIRSLENIDIMLLRKLSDFGKAKGAVRCFYFYGLKVLEDASVVLCSD